MKQISNFVFETSKSHDSESVSHLLGFGKHCGLL